MRLRRSKADWFELAKELAIDLREAERLTQKERPFSFHSLDRWEAAMAKEKKA